MADVESLCTTPEGDAGDMEKPMYRKTYYSRWLILAVCMLTAYASGSAYDFGLYSDQLKSNLGYSESEITLLASCANAGLYSMILSGLCLEFIGPRYNFLVGGVVASTGYFFLWAIASTKLASNIVGSCLMLYLGTFGTSFFSVTCTTLAVANFPTRDRGKAVGIMKAFLGVGISINSQMYSTWFNSLDYLIGLAIFLPSTALIAATVVNFIPRRDLDYTKEETEASGKPAFWNWMALICGTAIWVGIATFLDDEEPVAEWAVNVMFLPTVALMAVGVGYFPFMYGPIRRTVTEAGDEETSLLGRPGKPAGTKPAILGDESKEMNDFTLFEMLSTAEFWLLFFVFTIGAGVCLTVVNNVAGIIDAFDSTEGTAVPLMLFGLFETAGRLSVSFSDVFGSRVARIFLLDAALVMLFICCLLLAYDNMYTLNVCIVVVSYCYGFLYADVCAIVADLFGVKHFGGNLGFALFAPIIGSFAFASGVVDLFYEDGCAGSLCYRYVFLTEAVCCLLATVLCLFLKLRIMERFQVTSVSEIFRRRRSSAG